MTPRGLLLNPTCHFRDVCLAESPLHLSRQCLGQIVTRGPTAVKGAARRFPTRCVYSTAVTLWHTESLLSLEIH